MKYTEVNFTIAPLDPCRDLLVDALGNEGPYDSFVEIPDGLKAYVPSTQFDKEWLQQQVDNLQDLASIHYSHQEMPDKNWNEEWEKQHKPVLVVADNGKQVWVRAPFHDHRADVDYEIEIEPKMSFGTAHHPTTYMMLSYVAELDMVGKRVLDMGCGTAVLAILAKMRGASYVEGVDIDEWAFRNARENAASNNVEIALKLGDASTLQGVFDIIIANINRNILLADMERYAAVLNPGGTLLLSGFYEADEASLIARANELGMVLRSRKNRDGWSALELKDKKSIRHVSGDSVREEAIG